MKNVLSQADANSTLDLISLCLECQNPDDFISLVDELKYVIGFSFARCGIADFDLLKSNDADGMKMIMGYPEEWEKRYHEKGYICHDRVAAQAFLKPGLLYWTKKDVADSLWPEKMGMYGKGAPGYQNYLQMMDEASSFGISQGWIHSSLGSKFSQRSFIAFTGDAVEHHQRSAIILNHILPHLTQALKKLILQTPDLDPKLTPRESEILSWLAEGKTAWEISTILSISSKTVEFHKGNILKKLNAVNTQQAVAVALSNNVIRLG